MRVLFRPEAREDVIVYQYQGDTLVVLACFHHRRSPRTLSDRIKR